MKMIKIELLLYLRKIIPKNVELMVAHISLDENTIMITWGENR
jgi:hypothetical protein